MKLEIAKTSKAVFKNCRIEQNEEGNILIIEDLGDKGVETRDLLEVIQEVFGEEEFNLTLQSKLEL